MSTITNNTILSNTKQVRYGATWSSIYDFLKPQVWQNIVKYYGPGVGLADFAHANGATIKVAGPTLTAYAEGSQYKLVELGAPIAITAAGANATAVLAAGEYDASNKCYLRVNDVVVIPAYYLQENGVKSIRPEEFQVRSIAGVGAAAQYTLQPHKIDVAIVAPVPTGTKLMVTGGLWANETSSGKPKASGWYTHTFKTSTLKEDGAIGGSTESNQRYIDDLNGGGKGVFNKQTIEVDLRLQKTLSDQIWISGGVTNAMTMLNRDLEAISVTGSVGLLQHLIDNAMPQYYTAAYDRPCFEDIKPALESQGVINADVNFFYGSELGRQLENCGLDFIKEFSGGTDFMKTMGYIDSSFKAVKFNGVNVMFNALSVLNDPIAYGADSFDDQFRSLGFLLPDVDVAVKKDPNSSEYLTMKNFTLAYKSYGKEDRTRIFKWLPGMNGLGVAGDIAVDTYDDLRFSLLTEFMVVALKFNQAILVQDDRILVAP